MEVFVTLEVFARLNVAMVVAAAATLRAALILFCLYEYSCPFERHCASPSCAECHHCHGVSLDYQSPFSAHNNHCNHCGYCLCFDQYSRWIVPTPSPVPWLISSRVNYCATTIKSCVDTAIASRCMGWSRGIDPRHLKRIIAAAIGVGCEKREVPGLSFLRRMRKESRRNGTREWWNP